MTHDVDACTIEGCPDCEEAICQRCGCYKATSPSPMPGDGLCGTCREKTDQEDREAS